MSMELSESQKAELLEASESRSLRAEFRALKRPNWKTLDVEQYLRFLTSMSERFSENERPVPMVDNDFRL